MRARLILVPALALVAAGVIWKFAPPPAPALAGTWRLGLGADVKQPRQYDDVAPETPFRLSLTTTAPKHVYVFSLSAEDGTLLLFPAPGMRSDCANPLPAGNTVLPGKDGDKELAWNTRTGIVAVTTVLAIAADQPIAELDALLPRLRHWSNTVFQDGAMNVTQPADRTTIVGKAHEAAPSPLLKQLTEIAVVDDNPSGALLPVPGLLGAQYSKWIFRERKK